MEDSLAKPHAKLDSIGSQLTKIDVIEQTMNTLVVENAALREEVRSKDKIIDELNEKVNRLDQSIRSNSLRIHGLPVNGNTPAAEIPLIVHKEILTPIFEAAKLKGDLPPQHAPSLHFTLSSAFAIPTKKPSASSPVVVKFYSEFIRSLIFKYKKEALPTYSDLSTNRIRPRFSIFEDLTPSNHTLLRTFANDPRVKSAWTFGGQVRFKTHQSDTIYRTSSLNDTYDSIIKPPSTSPSTAPSNNTQQRSSNRFVPLMDTS
jgi:hypothetical protein